MTKQIFFDRLDGTQDIALVNTRKIKGYFTTTIKIGDITRRVNSGMVNRVDSYNSAIQVLDWYKEGAVC